MSSTKLPVAAAALTALTGCGNDSKAPVPEPREAGNHANTQPYEPRETYTSPMGNNNCIQLNYPAASTETYGGYGQAVILSPEEKLEASKLAERITSAVEGYKDAQWQTYRRGRDERNAFESLQNELSGTSASVRAAALQKAQSNFGSNDFRADEAFRKLSQAQASDIQWKPGRY